MDPHPHSSSGAVRRPAENRIAAVDFLRTLAILFVLLSHVRAGFAFPESENLAYFWNQFTQLGYYGVCIFFVISGFLITRLLDHGPGGLEKPDLRWFYARRAGRILPLLAFMVLLGSFMFFFVDNPQTRYRFCYRNPDIEYSPWFWISIPTFSYNWFTSFHKAGDAGRHWSVLWSLAVEEQFYLFYPLLLRAVTGTRRLTVILLGFVLAGPVFRWVAIKYFPEYGNLAGIGSFTGFDMIALGALTYLCIRRFPTAPSAIVRWILVIAGIVLFTFARSPLDTTQTNALRILGCTYMGLAISSVLWGLVSGGIPGRPWFLWAALPGQLSYGLYLLHVSCLYFFHPFLRPLPWYLSVGGYLALTFSASWLSHRYFEMPANLAIRRRWSHSE